MYTILDPAQPVDLSSVTNADCPLTWTYVVDVAGAVPVLTFNAADPSFSLFYDTDLAPASTNDSTSNPFVSNYQVTITGSNSDGFSRECIWNLQIDTPCGDFTELDATNQGQKIIQRFGDPVKWYTINPFDL